MCQHRLLVPTTSFWWTCRSILRVAPLLRLSRPLRKNLPKKNPFQSPFVKKSLFLSPFLKKSPQSMSPKLLKRNRGHLKLRLEVEPKKRLPQLLRRKRQSVESSDSNNVERRNLQKRLPLFSSNLVVSVALCLAACSVVDVEQKCKEQALVGLKQYQARQFADAEQTYFAASELAKKSANALQYPLMLRELARSYIAQKKFDLAEASLQKAASYYQDLAKQPKSNRFDQSLVDEREYEILASLGEVCLAQNKNIEAKNAYVQAIDLGKRIVEPPTISGAVHQSYIKTLEKTGERARAEQMQRQLDASSLTTFEFDERFAKALVLLSKGDYEGSEKILETLQLAAQGFVGNTSRSGRAKAYAGLFKVIRNSPFEAQLPLSEAVRLLPRSAENFTELCYAYTLLGVSEEMRGDTKSGIAYYRKAFAMHPFLLPQVLIMTRDGLLKFGHPQQAQIVLDRLKLVQSDPQFHKEPVTALDFVTLSRQDLVLQNPKAAKELRLKGLLHLEHHSDVTGLAEMRGAFQLYKSYAVDNEKELSRRALKQLYAVGGRTPEGRMQLRKIAEREQLAPP